MNIGNKPDGIHRHQLILAYPGVGKYSDLLHGIVTPFKFTHNFLLIDPKPIFQIVAFLIDNDGFIDKKGEYLWFEDAKNLPEVKIFTDVASKDNHGQTDRIVWSSHSGVIYRKAISEYGQRIDGMVNYFDLLNNIHRVSVNKECMLEHGKSSSGWIWNPNNENFREFTEQLKSQCLINIDKVDPWTIPADRREGWGFTRELAMPA